MSEVKLKPLDAESIRNDFPILKRNIHGKLLIYLDNAATTQKPVQVIDAIRRYYENSNANVHRAVHSLSVEATELYEKAHEDAAKLIGAEMEEVVFTKNSTEAANLVLYSWALNELKPGDEIVTTIMEHHSNIVPWQFMRKKGVKLHFVDITEDGMLDIEQYKAMVGGKTRLVAATHCSNALGTINPVKEMGEIAHDAGSVFLVDAAQSVPHMPVSVKEIGCDFLYFSGHKMLAPTGIGALYGRKELLEKMEPFLYGGDMIKEVHAEGATWNDVPWKFEAGTPNMEGAVGLSAAIKYLNQIGLENVREHGKELTGYALKKLRDSEGLHIYGPMDAASRGGIVSFNVEGVHAHDVATILDSEGIAVRSGHHCAQPLMDRLGIPAAARASFYIYNTKKEIDALAAGLEKVRKIFRK